MRQILLILATLVLSACVLPNAGKTERLRLGMTKEDVFAVLGRPASVGADQEAETLYYRLVEANSIGLPDKSITFYVRFVEGKVESFGRIADPDPYPVIVPTPIPTPVPVPSQG